MYGISQNRNFIHNNHHELVVTLLTLSLSLYPSNVILKKYEHKKTKSQTLSTSSLYKNKYILRSIALPF